MTPADLYSLDRDPTFDQLKNAFTGYAKQEKTRVEAIRNIVFGSMRYGASNIASVWSSQAASYIAKQPFEWERPQKKLTREESKQRVESWLNAR